jgi:hypothetical protein
VWCWLILHSQRGNHQLHLPTVLRGYILWCTGTLSGQCMHPVWGRDILEHNGGHRVKHLSVLPGRGIPDWDGRDFQRCVCPVCCWNLLWRGGGCPAQCLLLLRCWLLLDGSRGLVLGGEVAHDGLYTFSSESGRIYLHALCLVLEQLPRSCSGNSRRLFFHNILTQSYYCIIWDV